MAELDQKGSNLKRDKTAQIARDFVILRLQEATAEIPTAVRPISSWAHGLGAGTKMQLTGSATQCIQTIPCRSTPGKYFLRHSGQYPCENFASVCFIT